MSRRLRRFLSMQRADRRLFLAAWLSLPAIDLMLRLLGFERTRRLLERATRPGLIGEASHLAVASAAEMAGIIAIAGRHTPTNGSCLRQALLLWALLRRRGLSPALRIGVSKQSGFSAHAWVELAGHPLNQPADLPVRFTPIERLTAAGDP